MIKIRLDSFLSGIIFTLLMNFHSNGHAEDCLSRYQRFVTNQAAQSGQEALYQASFEIDENDRELGYILEAAKRIEAGEWEFGEHTSIEMERFFSLILNLENPEMEQGYHAQAGELPVLLNYMELAHLLNVASLKGFLCKEDHMQAGFFYPLRKIRQNIREGLLPSLVSYAEEQGLHETSDANILDCEDNSLFALNDLESINVSSDLSESSLINLNEAFDSSQLEVSAMGESVVENAVHLEFLPAEGQNQQQTEIASGQLEHSAHSVESGENEKSETPQADILPDPNDVKIIDLSEEPALSPSLEERQKTRTQHFAELDELYR